MTRLHAPGNLAAETEAAGTRSAASPGLPAEALLVGVAGHAPAPTVPARAALAKGRPAKAKHGAKPADTTDAAGDEVAVHGQGVAEPTVAAGLSADRAATEPASAAKALPGQSASKPASKPASEPAAEPGHGGGSILPYALGGLAVIGGGVALAGGGSGGTTAAPKTPSAVDTPSLALAADTGSSATDGITSRGTVAVSSLQSGAKWEYSTDSGTTWSTGTGSSFILAQGSYAAGNVQVRQTDAAGTVSAVGKLAAAVTVDTATPAPTIDPVAGDNVLTPGEAADPAGVRITGTAEANATVSITWRTPGSETMATGTAQANAAGKWEYTFKGAGIPDAKALLETTVMVSATDVAGNGSDIVRRTVMTDPGVTVSGVITAGPVMAGNDLTVSIYTGAGKLLASGIPVKSDGSFSVANLAAAKGDVLIASLTNGPAADYRDEATGRVQNLSAGLLAAITVVDPATVLNINPLTTLSARNAGLSVGSDGVVTGTASAQTVDAANTSTAMAFGLTGTALVALAPEVIPDAGYPASAKLTSGQQAGVLLAALSGLDLRNGGNAQKTIDDLVGLLSTGSGDTGALAGALILGAREASGRLGLALVARLSDQLASGSDSGTGSTSLSIATVAGDGVVNRAEAAGLVITGQVAAGATAVTLDLGGLVRSARIDGETWSYTVQPTDLADANANGTLLLKAQATLADGSAVSASRTALLATALPAAPTIGAVLGDDLVSKGERNAGVVVTGTAAPGTSVTVSWNGAAARDVPVGATGEWTTTFRSSEIPARDGASTLSAVASDRFGNVGETVNHTVTVDLTAPDKPAVDPVNGLDIISAASARAGVVVSGSGEVGGKVLVSWADGQPHVETIDASGRWTTTFASTELPSDGSQLLSVRQIDAAGNEGASVARPVLIVQGASGLLLAPIGGGDGLNLTEASAGVVVAGVATPGTSLVLAWEGTDPKQVVADEKGLWSVTYAFGDVPADGTRRITVSGTDAAGAAVGPVTRDVAIDTQPPAAPALGQVALDDVINNAERAAGIEVTGSGEPGTTVRVVWEGVTHTETVQANRSWRVVFSPDEVPSDRNVSTITASLTDAVGNTSLTSTRSVSVQTARPAAPGVALKTDTGADSGDGVTADGRIVVSGVVAGASWEFSTDGGDSWLSGTQSGVRFDDGTIGFVLGDDRYAAGLVQVRQTDSAGNRSDEARIANALTIKSSRPIVELDPVTDDGRINADERAEGITLFGSISNMVDGIPVTVKVTWTGAGGTPFSRIATFTSSDSWTVALAPSELPAGDGRFAIAVDATDSVGNASATLQRSVEVKTSLPAAPVLTLKSDTGASATDGITSDPVVLVTGVARGQPWEYSTDGGLIWQPGTAGNGTIRLSDGRYGAGQLQVRQIDTFANKGVIATYDKVLVIDSEISEPTIDPIGANGIINAALKQSGVTISGTAEAGATVTLAWHGKEYRATAVANDAAGTGIWSIVLPTAEIPGDGDWPVTVTAIDPAGNRSSAIGTTAPVTVDTRLPGAPSIDAVATDDVISAAERGEGITITGRTDPGTDVSVGFGGVIKAATVNELGGWTVTYAPAEVPADAARVGITATATNARANSSPAGQRFVEVDTVTSAPVVDAPSGGLSVNAARKAEGLAVSGTAEAGAVVVLTLGDQVRSATADAKGVWQTTFATWQLPGDGQATLIARATDEKGNASKAVSTPVLFDTTAPAAATLSTIGGDNIITVAEAASPVSIAGTAEQGARVALSWDGRNVPVTLKADGSWTAQLNLTPGTAGRDVQVAATVTDAAGNTSKSFARTVFVAGTGQAGPVIAPVAIDDRINAAERAGGVRVSGLGTANSLLDLYANGQKVGSVQVGSNGQWTQSFGADALPQAGAWSLSLKNGNDTLYSRDVIIDIAGPSAPTVSDVGLAGAASNAGDLIVTAAEKSAGMVRVSGSSEGQAFIQVQWGGVTKTAVADAAGKWFADFTSGEVPASGDSAVQVSAIDVAGNAGASATFTIKVNTDVVGTDGNDTLQGTGYGDVLSGGAGDDVLIIPDLAFRKVDGGAGNDTLKLGPAIHGGTLDLTHLAAGQLTNIEAISIAGGNHLVVDSTAILADTSVGKLVVTGAADDRVTAFGFSKTGTASADGHLYGVYTSGSATLWVDQSIQHIVI